MEWDFFPLQPGLSCQEPLVGEHKAGQVPGVSVRGLGNGLQLLPETEGKKQLQERKGKILHSLSLGTALPTHTDGLGTPAMS